MASFSQKAQPQAVLGLGNDRRHSENAGRLPQELHETGRVRRQAALSKNERVDQALSAKPPNTKDVVKAVVRVHRSLQELQSIVDIRTIKQAAISPKKALL